MSTTKLLFLASALAIVLIAALACAGDEPEPLASPVVPTAQPTAQPTTVSVTATAVPAPAPSPTATPETGVLTIAVGGTGSPNGVPRFCGPGCAEIVYLSGFTETLFNAVATDQGIIATEPLLALEFSLDPELRYGDFTLREGVQFHDGWGEMTSEDVAFSFNDANSVINPESIHGQAGDFAALIRSMEPIDKYTVRLNYNTYDSRGMLHRFSTF